MGNKKALLTLVALSTIIIFASPLVWSTKINISQINVYIDDSIQSAINDAQEGDTIFIQNGVHIEDSYPIFVNKTVTLVGENVDATVIDGWETSTVIFQAQADGTKISSLTIQNTTKGEGGAGVHLFNVKNIEIANCKIRKCNDGIILTNSTSSKIARNKIIDNHSRGIRLHENSSFNMFTDNNISTNPTGIWIADLESKGNKFYHNNFVNNFYQKSEIAPGNAWDNGYPSGGNYWSDYNGEDAEPDGIGDTSYEDADNYPLMGMFSSFNTSTGKHVNIVSNSTVEDFEYFESNSTITMHVSNMTTSQTFGFCQICIPHALMSDSYNVTINGALPYYSDYNIADNGTHRWIYFNYQHSTLEIVIVPEFPSILIMPLLMIAVLLATLVYKRRANSLTT